MIEIQKLKLKNFYSVGQVEQEVILNNTFTTLVMGSNKDQEGENGTNRNGVGKAQPLYSKIRVPNGWKTMKSIGVGDIVMTPDGRTTVVTGKYPQGKKKVYEITTGDGKKTRACKEHLWTLADGQVVNTAEMFKLLKTSSVFLPTACVKLDQVQKIDVDLYLLGAIINKFQTHTGEDLSDELRLHIYDENVISRLERINVVSGKGNGYIVIREDVVEKAKTFFDFDNKNLSDIVFSMEYDQKIRFLKGFCDSNAELSKTSLKFYFANRNMATQVRELFWSVGAVAKLSKIVILSKADREYTGNQDIILKVSHSDLNQFFTLAHNFTKVDVYNEVVKIDYVGEEEACCIKIASDEKLYITDCFIPTHNTTIINALSYALYGTPISKVKRKNTIINRFNGKQLSVKLWFKANGIQYYIERGMKPDVMKFVELDENGNEKEVKSQGSNSNSDAEIQRILGMSHLLCKYVMIMSTYATPFMDEDASKQRAIIEELLMIDRLSEKADRIKVQESEIKKELEKEQVKNNVILENNKRLESTLIDIIEKEKRWDSKKEKDLIDLKEQLSELLKIDIEEERLAHEHNEVVTENKRLHSAIAKEIESYEWKLNSVKQTMLTLNQQLDKIEHQKVCHACSQTLTDALATEQKNKIINQLTLEIENFDQYSSILKQLNEELSKIPNGELKQTLYKSIVEVTKHNAYIETITTDIEKLENENNPYTEQISDMKEKGLELQEVDYSKVEEYERILNHYKFLKKLLINKDSFIRKLIIKQYLTYLNNRLKYYLEKLGLPHKVSFDSSLGFDITHMGIDTDYNLLSRGEQNRATFALNLAFMDIFEHTRYPLNILFVDELLDFGVDSSGALAGLSVLKNISTEQQKATFLVSHKEELIEKVPNIIYVLKENGFTNYERCTNGNKE